MGEESELEYREERIRGLFGDVVTRNSLESRLKNTGFRKDEGHRDWIIYKTDSEYFAFRNDLSFVKNDAGRYKGMFAYGQATNKGFDFSKALMDDLLDRYSIHKDATERMEAKRQYDPIFLAAGGVLGFIAGLVLTQGNPFGAIFGTGAGSALGGTAYNWREFYDIAKLNFGGDRAASKIYRDRLDDARFFNNSSKALYMLTKEGRDIVKYA